MSIKTRYSKKRGAFTAKLEDPRFILETKVKFKRSRHLDDDRIEVLKDFLVGMLNETVTGFSLVKDRKQRIFREYCKARSNALRYVNALEELKFYEKKKPVPSDFCV